jgi:hypothetical protein
MAPKATPTEATIMIDRNEMTFDPIAEFKKFTASLLTPTTRSAIAKTASAISTYKKKFSIDGSKYRQT